MRTDTRSPAGSRVGFATLNPSYGDTVVGWVEPREAHPGAQRAPLIGPPRNAAPTAGLPAVAYFIDGNCAVLLISFSAVASMGSTVPCWRSSSPMADCRRYIENSSV